MMHNAYQMQAQGYTVYDAMAMQQQQQLQQQQQQQQQVIIHIAFLLHYDIAIYYNYCTFQLGIILLIATFIAQIAFFAIIDFLLHSISSSNFNNNNTYNSNILKIIRIIPILRNT